MSALAAAHHIRGPHIDWGAISPLVVLAGGGIAVLLVGVLRGRTARERVVPLLTLATLAGAIAFEIARFRHGAQAVSGALAIDDLALLLDLVFSLAAIAAVLLSLRRRAPRAAGQGEYHALLLFSVMGMGVLVSAQNLVTLFLGIELLSIPLYVLCAAEARREGSLESGLKYLVIGSVGSATLVYGLAMVYGATGSTDFATISGAVSQGKLSGGILGDPLLLTGLALVIAGFAFKASVAPFHQWTPDVYQGAPTPITAFMATATKAAALGVFVRFFDVAAIGAQNQWAPLIATIATITIIVGNAGALGQSSLKRMLGYSGVAQAGYMLGGLVVGTQLGVQATVLYLAVYLAMNLAAFAVVVAVERPGEDGDDDDIGLLAGLGARAPWLAWPMTVAMLSLAGIPGTVGFIGKFQLIHALIAGDYTWLAIVLVVGSMISLGYYLRVVATIWMRPAGAVEPPSREGALAPIAGASEPPFREGPIAPIAGASEPPFREGPIAPIAGASEPPSREGPIAPIAGASEELGEGSPSASRPAVGEGSWSASRAAVAEPEVALVGIVFAAACVFFGIFPSPLFHLASHAGHALAGLL